MRLNKYNSFLLESAFMDLLLESFNVQFELGEIEATSTRSKVKVISMVASQSQYNNLTTKIKLKEMVDLTWMNSDDIEWIEDDLAKRRNDKIDKILN